MFYEEEKIAKHFFAKINDQLRRWGDHSNWQIAVLNKFVETICAVAFVLCLSSDGSSFINLQMSVDQTQIFAF